MALRELVRRRFGLQAEATWTTHPALVRAGPGATAPARGWGGTTIPAPARWRIGTARVEADVGSALSFLRVKRASP